MVEWACGMDIDHDLATGVRDSQQEEVACDVRKLHGDYDTQTHVRRD